jgi:hypothetical protein
MQQVRCEDVDRHAEEVDLPADTFGPGGPRSQSFGRRQGQVALAAWGTAWGAKRPMSALIRVKLTGLQRRSEVQTQYRPPSENGP